MVTGGTRKVQKFGGSLAVTLPDEFVRTCNIKEGDLLPCVWTEKVVKFFPVRKPAPVKV